MIFLRPIYSYDIDKIYEIKSNPKNFNEKFTNIDTSQITKESVKKWFYNIINETNTIRFGICLLDNNTLIGCITLGKVNYINKLCELHIYIDNIYQGKGLGYNSLLLVTNYCKNILKFKCIYLYVHKDHIKAIKLYKQFGFNELPENNNNNNIYMIYNI